MPAQRPTARRSRDAHAPRRLTRAEVFRYHLGGLAFLTPPTVVAGAYFVFVPQMAFVLYVGGFFAALALAFVFSIWLSDRVRGFDDDDLRPETDH
jgi:hypothetical protein